MPVGAVSLIAPICHRLSAQRPESILDLGCGFGLWGALVRSYLDHGVAPFTVRMIGVEGWCPYRNPAWDLYTHVNTMPITDFLTQAKAQYGAVLILDVIEHFYRPDADRVLQLAWDRVAPGGDLIVGTPAIWMEQGDVYGNTFERHRDLWSADEFAERGFAVWMDGSPDQWGNRMILAVRSKPC